MNRLVLSTGVFALTLVAWLLVTPSRVAAQNPCGANSCTGTNYNYPFNTITAPCAPNAKLTKCHCPLDPELNPSACPTLP